MLKLTFAIILFILGVAVVPAAHAQQLPGLPAVDAINASVQVGWVYPDRSAAVPTVRADEGDLWGFGVESEFHLPLKEGSKWAGTLGLGYNQFNLRADIGAGRRLRGTLRDLPALTLYTGRASSDIYFGFTIAISELANGRIHGPPEAGMPDPSPIKVSAAAVSTGLAVGFEVNHFFVEAGYMGRFFPSLAYDGLPASGFPDDLGESMYAGGFMIRVGGTLGVKAKPPAKEVLRCLPSDVEVTSSDKFDYKHTCEGGVMTITVVPKPTKPAAVAVPAPAP